MRRLGLAPDRELVVLLVDDDVVDRMTIKRALRASELGARVVETSDAVDAMRALAAEPVDVAIVDYFLPGANGLELIGEMRAVSPLLPIVFLTGQGDEELAATIMRTGGAEYLSKNGLTALQLVQSLRYALSYSAAQQKQLEQKRALEETSRELAESLKGARAAARARDDVLAIVSHDLRNPLNVISMSLSMLEEQSTEDTARPLIDKMQRAVVRMNRLIEDLLDASRIDAATMSVDTRPVRAADLLESALDAHALSASAKGVSLVRGLFDGAVRVNADRHRIGQVYGNLVGNAVKFTPKGGTVTLEIRPHADDGFMTFAVRDSGAGIPEHVLPHVFERFWKERGHTRDGAGLGLYIADGIVRAHGGGMAVTSQVGAGSEFSFWLPRVGDGT